MAYYIDGFTLPIPKDKLCDYQQLVKGVADIWKEHGAIDYQEFVGDDMNMDGVGSFEEMVKANPDEVVIFGWAIFESKDARDLANDKVAKDPRVASIIEAFNSGFDAKRMAYAGFKPLI